MTRSLSNQQNKVNSQNVDNYERLNKRIDTEIKSLESIVRDAPKEEKTLDETKVNARMERLGKEISLIKTKQAELSQNFDTSMSKQSALGNFFI